MITYLKLRIALSIFSGIGLIFYIVAFIIPRWSKNDSGNDGLWQKCFLNGGVSTCSVWTAELKTDAILAAQALACIGLIFYCIFTVVGALTIFWTNHWKTAKVIKYMTFVVAVLAVIFVAACTVIYQNNGSSESSADISLYFAVISCVIAGIASPFYFIDAIRTVEPEKPKKKARLFKNMNVPPQPTMGKFGKKESAMRKTEGRPPLLSELTRQKSLFVLRKPTKKANNKLTLNDIALFPLPPTKTKLNLMNKSETENHPVPKEAGTEALPEQVSESDDDVSILDMPHDSDNDNIHNNKKLTLNDIATFPLPPTKTKLDLLDKSDKENHPAPHEPIKEEIENEDHIENTSMRVEPMTAGKSGGNDSQNHSVFKFHQTKTIKKDEKTKIQDKETSLPPALMIMPTGDDRADGVGEEKDSSSHTTKGQEGRKLDNAEARQKLEPYEAEALPTEQLNKKSIAMIQKNMDLLKRIKKVSGVYSSPGNLDLPMYPNQPKKQRRRKKKKKNKRPMTGKSVEVETCVGTEPVSKQDGASTDYYTEEDETDFEELKEKSDSESEKEEILGKKGKRKLDEENTTSLNDSTKRLDFI